MGGPIRMAWAPTELQSVPQAATAVSINRSVIEGLATRRQRQNALGSQAENWRGNTKMGR